MCEISREKKKNHIIEELNRDLREPFLLCLLWRMWNDIPSPEMVSNLAKLIQVASHWTRMKTQVATGSSSIHHLLEQLTLHCQERNCLLRPRSYKNLQNICHMVRGTEPEMNWVILSPLPGRRESLTAFTHRCQQAKLMTDKWNLICTLGL